MNLKDALNDLYVVLLDYEEMGFPKACYTLKDQENIIHIEDAKNLARQLNEREPSHKYTVHKITFGPALEFPK